MPKEPYSCTESVPRPARRLHWCNTRPIWLLSMACILVPMSLTTVRAEFRPPHFPANPADDFLQSSSSPWIPGRTTKLVFLMAETPFDIQVKVLGDKHYWEVHAYTLQYKCSNTDGAFQEKLLHNFTSSSELPSKESTLCQGARSFSLKSLMNDTYQIVLSNDSSKIPFSQAFSHAIELRLRVHYFKNSMTSASLHISNFDSIFNINTEPVQTRGVDDKANFTRFMFTEETMEFLSGRKFTGFKFIHDIIEFQMLDTRFVEIVGNASTLIRSLLSVELSIEVHNSECRWPKLQDSLEKYVCSLFPFRISSVFRRTHHDARYGISLSTGKLHSHKRILPNLYDIYYKSFAKPKMIRFTIYVSLSTKNPYSGLNYTISRNMLDFQRFQLHNRLNYRINNATKSCTTLDEQFDGSQTLFLHEGEVVFQSPIVCNSPDWREKYYRRRTYRYRQLTHVNNEFCSNSDLIRSQLCNLVNVSEDGRIVTVDTHSKNLTQLKSITFSDVEMTPPISYKYTVHLVQMPCFATNWEPNLLPRETVKMLNMPVTFQCQTHHSNLRHNVFIYAEFEVSPYWKRVSLDTFAMDYLHRPPNAIVEERSALDRMYKLTVKLPSVTHQMSGLQFVFVCRVTVIRESVRLIGVPSYSTEVASFVQFTGEERELFNRLGGCVLTPTAAIIAGLSVFVLLPLRAIAL